MEIDGELNCLLTLMAAVGLKLQTRGQFPFYKRNLMDHVLRRGFEQQRFYKAIFKQVEGLKGELYIEVPTADIWLETVVQISQHLSENAQLSQGRQSASTWIGVRGNFRASSRNSRATGESQVVQCLVCRPFSSNFVTDMYYISYGRQFGLDLYGVFSAN